MNKIHFPYKLLIILFSVFLFASCTDEALDPVLANQIAQQQADDNNNGGGGNGGGSTLSGDYWPTALNNEWIMKLNGVEQPPMKIISIDNINSFTYYTFSQASGQGGSASASGTQRLRKNSGDYYMKLEDMNINAGGFTGVQTGFEMLLFKDYLNAGETWTGNYVQTTTYNNPIIPVISMNTNYTCTIVETGSTLAVNNVSYSNVIKMRLHQSTQMTGLPTTEADTDYWFAKNVGPIKTITYSPGTTIPQSTSELFAYTLN